MISEQDLIYGKNPMTRIVNIEVNDDIAEVYRELEDRVESKYPKQEEKK